QIACVGTRTCERVARAGDDALPDLEGIVLDPARPREVLSELAVSTPEHAQLVVDDEARGPGRPLVDRENHARHPMPRRTPLVHPSTISVFVLVCTKRGSGLSSRGTLTPMAEIVSLADAVRELVRDGDSVALEGFTHLIPHAAGHE